jgi:DNA-binding CsgD family transcriptional regulator
VANLKQENILFIIGMMLFQTWIHATVAAPVFEHSAGSPFLPLIHSAALMLSLLLFVLFTRAFCAIIKTPALLICVVTLAIVGSCLMAADFFFPAVAKAVIIIGTIATALSTGALLALWGEAYARVSDMTFQAVATFMGMAGSFLLYLLIVALPSAVAVITVIILPLALLVCFWRILISKNPAGDGKPAVSSPIESFPKLLMYILAFSLPLSFLETLLLNNAEILSPGDWVLVYFLTLVIVSVIVMVEYSIRKRKFSIILISIILFVTICLLSFFLYDTTALIMRVFMGAGYYLFLASFYTFLGSSILSSDRAPFRVFALGNCANTCGFLLGWGIGLAVDRFFSSWAAGFAVAIVYLLFFVGLFIMPTAKVKLFAAAKWMTQPNESVLGHGNLMDDIQALCTLAANEYLLSPREQEILNYLMRGRNLPSIAKSMFLAESTIKTHVNHIYRKLDVHKREELISQIELLKP